jgi:hypothetical protein
MLLVTTHHCKPPPPNEAKFRRKLLHMIFLFFPNVGNKFWGEFCPYFLYFEKIKVAYEVTLLSVCLCGPPPNFCSFMCGPCHNKLSRLLVLPKISCSFLMSFSVFFVYAEVGFKCKLTNEVWGCHYGDYVDYYTLEFDAVYYGRSLPTFRRKVLSSSSGLKSHPRKQKAASDFLLSLLYDSEDRGSTFSQYVGKLLPDCMAPHPTK